MTPFTISMSARQPSPRGRGARRRRGVRGFAHVDYFNPLPGFALPRTFNPLTRPLRGHPLPLGEGLPALFLNAPTSFGGGRP